MSMSESNIIYLEEKNFLNAKEKSEATLIVYSQFLLSYFNTLQKQDYSLCFRLKVLMYDMAVQLPISKSIRDSLRNYLLSNRPLNLISPLDELVMRESVQFIYDKTCELFGPIKADSVMSTAVRDTQQLPEAIIFHPRELL